MHFYAARWVTHCRLACAPAHFNAFCNAYGLVLFDRFGTVPSAMPMAVPAAQRYLPRVRPMGAAYADLCVARAQELMASGRRLRLYWSGGIDSTAMLVAFILAGARRKQVEVALSYDSLIEHGRFFDAHICDRFDLINAPSIAESVASDAVITIDGEHNDQLFGSDVMMRVTARFGDAMLRRRCDEAAFVEIMPGVVRVTPTDAAAFYHEIIASADGADVELETVYDVLWWTNFAFKWQDVAFRSLTRAAPALRSKLTEARVAANLVHFYGSRDFQDWAVSRREEKMPGGWRTYKAPAKAFIHKFDRDDEFLANAVKIGSLRNLPSGARDFVGITAPWNFVTSWDAFEPAFEGVEGP